MIIKECERLARVDAMTQAMQVREEFGPSMEKGYNESAYHQNAIYWRVGALDG